MPEASAWLRQAVSDLQAAERVFDSKDCASYCQVISKYQQAIEKSIKALAIQLRENGYLATMPGYSHDPSKLLSVLKRLPRRDLDSVLVAQRRIDLIFSADRESGISAICALAPRKPAAGQPAAKNTEYPYNRADGLWYAPADEGTFTPRDVERFRRIAGPFYEKIYDLVSALQRDPMLGTS